MVSPAAVARARAADPRGLPGGVTPGLDQAEGSGPIVFFAEL
jgi:hypothetical protein